MSRSSLGDKAAPTGGGKCVGEGMPTCKERPRAKAGLGVLGFSLLCIVGNGASAVESDALRFLSVAILPVQLVAPVFSVDHAFEDTMCQSRN